MRTRRRTLAVATTALASTLLAAAPAAAFEPVLTTSPPRIIGAPGDFTDALGQATSIFDHISRGLGTALESKAVEEAAARQQQEQQEQEQQSPLVSEQPAQEPTMASEATDELGDNVEDVLSQTADLSESVASTTESLVGNLDQVLKGFNR